jgi:hypothetical protein
VGVGRGHEWLDQGRIGPARHGSREPEHLGQGEVVAQHLAGLDVSGRGHDAHEVHVGTAAQIRERQGVIDARIAVQEDGGGDGGGGRRLDGCEGRHGARVVEAEDASAWVNVLVSDEFIAISRKYLTIWKVLL